MSQLDSYDVRLALNSGDASCSRIATAVHFRRPTTRLRMRAQPSQGKGQAQIVVELRSDLPLEYFPGELRGSRLAESTI